jgi:hypothetical protein
MKLLRTQFPGYLTSGSVQWPVFSGKLTNSVTVKSVTWFRHCLNWCGWGGGGVLAANNIKAFHSLSKRNHIPFQFRENKIYKHTSDSLQLKSEYYLLSKYDCS